MPLELISLFLKLYFYFSQGWTIPLVISTLVIAIIISSCRGSGTHHTPITRAEIERVLYDMPEGQLHRRKRSGSDAGMVILYSIHVGQVWVWFNGINSALSLEWWLSGDHFITFELFNVDSNLSYYLAERLLTIIHACHDSPDLH